MNNKGFTLIELILVIALLSLIALLATPNAIKMINKNKVDDYNSVIDSVASALDLYVSDNRYNLVFNGHCEKENAKYKDGNTGDGISIQTTISLSDLTNGNYLTSPINNFCTDKSISETENKIVISLNCKTKEFDYSVKPDNDTLKNKDNSQIATSINDMKIENCDIYN